MARIFILLFFIPLLVFGGEQLISISNPNPFPGEAVVVNFEAGLKPTRVEFDGEEAAPFLFKNSYRAIFGIAVTKKPGDYSLKIYFSNGEVLTRSIRVRPKNFPIVELGIPKEVGLAPKELVQKLQAEKVNLAAILTVRTPEIFFQEKFGLPLADNRKITSFFGEIRKTGSDEIRHLGVDLKADLGKSVYAINAGIVRKAYYDQVYGNSVIVDHGQGIYSLYLHLDKIKVKEGDFVKKGDVVGAVGKSGYATSPHLHLSLKIGNISVDPIRFVSVFK